MASLIDLRQRRRCEVVAEGHAAIITVVCFVRKRGSSVVDLLVHNCEIDVSVVIGYGVSSCIDLSQLLHLCL